MAVEEPSVVAAFSNAAKMARAAGGFEAEADPPVMIGQVQLMVPDRAQAEAAAARIEAHRDEIDGAARAATERLARRGGGYVGLETRILPDPEGGALLVVHLLVNVCEAMGANAVNTACEQVAPVLSACTGCPVGLRILTNLTDRRLARAKVRLPVQAVGGARVAQGIYEADRFARVDPYRAATHNKGIMNGIDAVALATGNDWRALEAGVHAFAARDGQYRGLTRWRVKQDFLHGEIELPMALGTVGGLSASHPSVTLLRRILGAPDARSTASVFAAVGLAQNLAALRALVDEGIQQGHMALHAKQLALAAGAQVHEVDEVVRRAKAAGAIAASGVQQALAALRKEG